AGFGARWLIQGPTKGLIKIIVLSERKIEIIGKVIDKKHHLPLMDEQLINPIYSPQAQVSKSSTAKNKCVSGTFTHPFGQNLPIVVGIGQPDKLVPIATPSCLRPMFQKRIWNQTAIFLYGFKLDSAAVVALTVFVHKGLKWGHNLAISP